MPKKIFKVTSAGSVDDGKSTILARLLLDTGSIFDDQLAKDFNPKQLADLLDGLESERDQGVTIDVAHRFFDSETRRYHIADSPGHEQYTRNMVTACASSDALLLVVDATAGLKPQTKLHLEVALKLGIQQIIFAINKMDLVGFSKKAFSSLETAVMNLVSARAAVYGPVSTQVIPISGLLGHNVVKSSGKLGWFKGATLLLALESLVSETPTRDENPVFAIQYVQRISGGGRRYLGSVISGEIKIGQQLLARDISVKVKEILVCGEQSALVPKKAAASLVLDSEIDLGTGDFLFGRKSTWHDEFEVDAIWFSEKRAAKGHRYLFKFGPATVSGSFTKIKKLDRETNSANGELSSIRMNEIQRCNLALTEKLPLEPCKEWLEMGRLIVIDPHSGDTVGACVVNHALRRSENITQHDFDVSPSMHAQRTGANPVVIWFTGLSGSGKSTIANALSNDLHLQGIPHFVLDGDNLRRGINKDLGFTEEDRTENIRRTAEIASLMADAGLVVLVSLISPLERDRDMAKKIVGEQRFRLIYVSTPLEECERRDPKGLYKKAREGRLPNFTGVSAPFETPKNHWFEAKAYDLSVRRKLLQLAAD